ncbi:MAG: radical SAM protein [Elusimicrobia bacterium]|nr:radical SAM protein [Elusimicrobiota bacterium]
MKIALINPPLIQCLKGSRPNPVITSLFFNSPPLGLCSIAAVLEQRGIAVTVTDAAVERLDFEGVVRRAAGADVVGLTATTCSIADAWELARRLKEASPAVLVLGGPHVSVAPEHALSCGSFDYGVIGEGEDTFPELLQRLASGASPRDVDGIVFREDGRLVRGRPRAWIQDLDRLPLPARHLLPIERYVPQPNDERARPKLSMVSSRGCPYQCIFCDKGAMGAPYRSFSPGYIVSEMEHLVRRYGARDIAFVDSLFTPSEERVDAIVREIGRRGLQVSWTCTVRANVIAHKETLRKMRDACCWRIRLGVESGNEEVLRFIRKKTTREQIRAVAGWADELGLQPKGFFMLGHLNETKSTMQETIDFAKSLPLKDVTVQINTPLPGATQFSMCGEYGTLLSRDFRDYTLFDPVFIPKAMSREDLESAVDRFYRSFYLRPVVVWRHLVRIRSLRDVKRYALAFWLLLYLSFRHAFQTSGGRLRAGGEAARAG